MVQALSSSKVPLVRVTINNYTYRSAVAVMGGKFMIGVSNENRRNARVAAGDTVDVDLELDKDGRAKKVFEGLSNSKKQRLVLPVANGKTPETRQRNIEKALLALREGKI